MVIEVSTSLVAFVMVGGLVWWKGLEVFFYLKRSL